jgi:preprotein translocase subunit SecE
MNPEIDPDTKTKVNNYVRYSSMVFQMAALIGLGVWGGRQLDQYLGLKFPAFTLVFLFVAIFVGMFWSLKDLLKKKE